MTEEYRDTHKIGLIGEGRLGLCLGILMEEAVYEVLASDVREDYVKDLQQNKISTNEPEIEYLLQHNENLTATTDNIEVKLPEGTNLKKRPMNSATASKDKVTRSLKELDGFELILLPLLYLEDFAKRLINNQF